MPLLRAQAAKAHFPSCTALIMLAIVFSMAWYKSVIQPFLVECHEHSLSQFFVLGIYTSLETARVPENSRDLNCWILHGIPLESVA